MIGFARYFTEAGFNVYVVTSRQQIGKLDPKLCKMLPDNMEIRTTLSWKPSDAFDEGNGPFLKMIKKCFRYIESKWFPIDGYALWIFPAIFESLRIVKTNKIDYTLITSPPHSTQWISILLKFLSKVFIITDYRDGSLHNYRHRLNNTKPSRFQLFTERLTIKYSDLILTNTLTNENLLEIDYPDSKGKTLVVMNGYLEEDLTKTRRIEKEQRKLKIVYTGELYAGYIDYVLDVFTELSSKAEDLVDYVEIHCAGLVTDYDLERIYALGLDNIIIHHGFLSYAETIELTRKCDVALLVQPNNKNISNVVPSKLFFYLGNNKPIIAFMPLGDSTDIINRVNAGVIMPMDDFDACVIKMSELIRTRSLSQYKFNEDMKNNYSRRTQSYILIDHLKKYLAHGL